MTKHPHARRLGVASIVAGLVAAATLAIGALPSAVAAGSNSLTVTAGEYAYKLSGKPKAGNVQVSFDNGGVEYHMMAVVKLKPGVTKAQLKKAALSESDDAFAKIAAGDGSVGAALPSILGPNQKESMITQLKAGHYGIVCFIPAPDGTPHVAHGMITTFDVSSAKSSLTPPQDGLVDITLTDTAVQVPSSGIPGKGYAKITNKGTTPRDFNMAVLNGSTTVAQADAYFNQLFEGTAPSGNPPAVINATVSSIPVGGTAYLSLDLAKGRYAYASSDSTKDNDPNEIFSEFSIS